MLRNSSTLFMKLHTIFYVSGVIILACDGIVMGSEATKEETKSYQVRFSKDDLKEKLTPEQYHVTQEQGTERAFTGDLWNNHKKGAYKCVVCGKELFLSDTKFDSGSGWPSFSKEVSPAAVDKREDISHGMARTEVTCSNCGAHLGHLFDDGPAPTGLRYCINSASLKFQPSDNANEAKSEL